MEDMEHQRIPIYKFIWTKFQKAINIENADLQSPDAFRRGQYALINLRCYPVDNISFGLEYQYGKRHNLSDGFSSVANKFNFHLRLIFLIRLRWIEWMEKLFEHAHLKTTQVNACKHEGILGIQSRLKTPLVNAAFFF